MPAPSIIHRFSHRVPQTRERMSRFAVLPLVLLSLALASPPAVGQEATTRASTRSADAIAEQREAAVEDLGDLRLRLRELNDRLTDLKTTRGVLFHQRNQAMASLKEAKNNLVTLSLEGQGPESRRVIEVAQAQSKAEEELKAAEKELDDLGAQIERSEDAAAELGERIDAKSTDINRLAEIEAEARADELLEQFRGRPTSEIENIVAQSELEQKQMRYTHLQAQLTRAKSQGWASAQMTDLEQQVAEAKTDLLRAQAEFALRQLEDERGGFEDRNAADSTSAAMQTEFFRGYLDAVERYAQLSSNPRNAGVAAVVTAADMLRDQPPQATIDFFAPLLEAGQFPDYTVETAVRLQLAEAYRAAGQTEQALETLRALIVAPEAE